MQKLRFHDFRRDMPWTSCSVIEIAVRSEELEFWTLLRAD